jgi:hypothetical protein
MRADAGPQALFRRQMRLAIALRGGDGRAREQAPRALAAVLQHTPRLPPPTATD